MISLVLFLFDFVLYALCNQWWINSLVAYFIYKNLRESDFDVSSYWMVLLILLQDFFLYGRFGLGLVWLTPLIFMIRVIKIVFHRYWWSVMGGVFVLFFIVLELIVVKKWLFMHDIAMKSTLGRIFGTITVMTCLTFFGTRGNRFLSVFRVKRGKSGLQTGGTPYKKGF